MHLETKPVIFGCQGLTVTNEEKTLFSQHKPLGFILFARNIDSQNQVKKLVASLRESVGWHCPILIDQEGGRVARIRPPLCPEYPSMETLLEQANQEQRDVAQTVYLNAQALATTLKSFDINVNCAPVADLAIEGADHIIGDRSFGADIDRVATYADAMAQGLLSCNVYPIIKHIPGHGRALCDSHKALPIVDTSRDILDKTDFEVFRRLRHLPLAMTAHIVYQAIDDTLPATLSPKMIQLIRQHIGFEGLIMSDDISMQALTGTLNELSQHILAAGCDIVLHCNGIWKEMSLIASSIAPCNDKMLARYQACFT